MTKRVLSAIIAGLILLPTLLIGGIYFTIAIYILSILGLHEFLKIKEQKKELPIFINLISYITLTVLVLFNQSSDTLLFMIDFRIIASLFLVFLIPTVLYHNQKQYSVNDAFYLIGGVFFLGMSFSLVILLRSFNFDYLIYLLLITIVTDTYAYITGRLVGKHKLIEVVSQGKTWEGTLGGTLMGTFVGTAFYTLVIDSSLAIPSVILMTLFLSIIGQFGDLTFSAIKRYYGKKDFSNIMPGHGGILDRFDSIIFVVLGFMFFISIL